METIYIDRESCIAYAIMALHTIFHSANKEITMEGFVEEIKIMFVLYSDEEKLKEKLEEVLKNEGKIKISINNSGIEKIGMTIEECAEYLGVSKQLVAELVKLPDFPCVKFKRRILINKVGINDWMNRNIGKFLKY